MIDWKPAKQETILGHNQRVEILNTTIDVLNFEETVRLVDEYVQKKIPLHLIGVNADKINELNQNEQLRQIVNSCGIINADGASVIMASKFLGKALPERVAGIDLMERLIQLSEQKNYRVYLLGAKQNVVEKTAEVLKKRYPRLQLCGFRNGYFKEADWHSVSEEIRALHPDFVFVGITSPLKEYLVEYFQEQGHNAVFMGVGGSFDVISGNIPRAPLWMQKAGLEWLFRVIQEPKRLFKRYFIGNTMFICSVIAERCRNKGI